MKDVVIALVPVIIAATLFFGVRTLFLLSAGLVAAFATEYVISKKLLKFTAPLGTLEDYSAAITSILLTLSLPVSTPVWLVILGNMFAIGVVKFSFGGLGNNIVNPALAGRAFLVASYPAYTTGAAYLESGILGKIPVTQLDALSGATPLMGMENLDTEGLRNGIAALFWGNIPGSMGEVSALAILIGAIYMIVRQVISVRIPLIFIGTVFLLNFITIHFSTPASAFSILSIHYSLYQILAGGLLMVAFFMATDMVTSPISAKGQAVFAVGCGILTFIIRTFGGYPEGVTYAVLLMNISVPLIDRYIKPRVYGHREAA
jgi:electron transport complex protein RnfD